MEFSKFLARSPVFLLKDLAAAYPNLTLRAVKERLVRAMKRGTVIRLRRDLYATVPPDAEPSRFEPDRFHVLAAAKADSVFCGHSSLELLGMAYSLWNECTAYTVRRREQFQLGSTRYVLLSHPKPLQRTGQEDLGVRSFDRAGVFVRGLGPERTLVDGFRSPRSFGGLGELVTSLRGLQILNWKLLEEVLTAFDERRVYAAVGWFLESRQSELEVPDALLDDLERMAPKVPVYLDRRMMPGKRVARWNLLVPERLTRMEDAGAPEF
ncbi:MAG: hypothetical protein AKCLJLPJ_00422 [Fimbriimonadales bacterium]|nr:hypothetical protein [Fimbriimonadales bacterium]